MGLSLMSYIHKLLLRRGLLDDILPGEEDLKFSDRPKIEAARAEIEARVAEEREVDKEVAAIIVRLRALDKKKHYGESLRKAFGGN